MVGVRAGLSEAHTPYVTCGSQKLALHTGYLLSLTHSKRCADMLFLALLFLTFSAGTGLTLAYAIFMKRFPTPRLPVFMHGVMSSAGLIFVVVYAIGHYPDYPLVGLILFVATALLGFYLFETIYSGTGPGRALLW